MNGPLLEVAANSIASALAAEAGGAGRVELCSALETGGLTPSHAVVALARERLHIPIHVLIRPRPGDFVFDDLECEVMRRDIAYCRALGCAGVVIGALDPDRNVDVPRCRTLREAASGMSVTFHRAFDFARDATAAFEDVVAIGCDRLLTSGQADDAPAGVEVIRDLVARARGRIVVMPGGGINARNIAAIARATGAREFHASAKVRVASRMRRAPARIGDMQDTHFTTDASEVRACVDGLRASVASASSRGGEFPPRSCG